MHRPAPPTRLVLAVTFAGGAAGALARAGLAEWVPPEPGAFPLATFAANVLGALLLGAVVARAPEPGLSRPLLAGGLCGALTTFSALQLELLELLDGGDVALAGAYGAASVAAGLAAVALGLRAGPRRP